MSASAAPSDFAAELVHVSKTFGNRRVLSGVSLSVRRGEFFSLVGPSGCGKTTTLRLLAGFERPDDERGGEVRIDGQRANDLRPYARNIGMVFQNYALFPHLSALRNVAFGLEQQRLPKDRVEESALEALALVQLDPSRGHQMPDQLSGGERQRVALARALVTRPRVLLLDEPLAALDPGLRREMQRQLKELNRSLGVTFVYVTHDQAEAMAMSDRVAVMDSGVVVQEGTPIEVYERPRTSFVAGFIGESNFFEGTLRARVGEQWEVAGKDGAVFRVAHADSFREGRSLKVLVRPERMTLHPPDASLDSANRLDGVLHDMSYFGNATQWTVSLVSGDRIVVRLQSPYLLDGAAPWQQGTRVAVKWRPRDGHVVEDA